MTIYLSPWIDCENIINRLNPYHLSVRTDDYARVRIDVMTDNIFYAITYSKSSNYYSCFNKNFLTVEQAIDYFDRQIIDKTFNDYRSKDVILLSRCDKDFLDKIKALR